MSALGLPACDCGSTLPLGKPGSAERFEHNALNEHHVAVLREVGAPAHIIAQHTPGTPEYSLQAIANARAVAQIYADFLAYYQEGVK